MTKYLRLGTYFFPMQLRGPTENGWNTSFASLSNRESPSQRSGMNSFGLEKLTSLRYALQWLTLTTV